MHWRKECRRAMVARPGLNDDRDRRSWAVAVRDAAVAMDIIANASRSMPPHTQTSEVITVDDFDDV